MGQLLRSYPRPVRQGLVPLVVNTNPGLNSGLLYTTEFFSAPAAITAVDIDAVTSVTANLASSVTFNHPVNASLTNTLLIVEVVLQRNGAATVSTVSGVTYNGVSMTRAARENTYGVNLSTEIWYLVAPTSGRNNVVVTLNNALTDDIVVGARTLYNVDQTSPIVTSTTNSAFASSITTNITTTAATDFLVDVLYTYAPQTTPQKVDYVKYANFNTYGTTSEKQPTSSGVNTMSWTLTGSADISHTVVAIKQYVASSNYAGTPTGFNITLTFGTPTITVSNNIAVTPTGASFPLTFGTPTISLGTKLTPSGATFTLTFGTPTISLETKLTPTGATFALTFGTPTITSGTSLTPSGATFALTFGTPTLSFGTKLTPSGATFNLTFGTPTISVAVRLTPTGASFPLTFGTPTLTLGGATAVTPTGFNINLTFGTPTILFSWERVQMWNGFAWVRKPTKVWNGTSWEYKTLKVWTGSQWK